MFRRWNVGDPQGAQAEEHDRATVPASPAEAGADPLRSIPQMAQELIEQPPQLGGCVHQALAEHPPQRLAEARQEGLPPGRGKAPALDLPSQLPHRPPKGLCLVPDGQIGPRDPPWGRGGLGRAQVPL